MGWLRKILRKNQLARRVYCESFALRYFWERMHLSAGKSFAQDGEDTKIKDLIGEVRWFVDVGAHDGISGSNTFYFALRGARGLCFEPVRETFHKLRALYRFDRRVRCRHAGISQASGSATIMSADFLSYLPETEDAVHTASSRDSFLAAPVPERITLLSFADAIAGAALPAEIDLLSVDVEGHELQVLQSVFATGLKVRCIVVETHLFDPQAQLWLWKHRDLEPMERLLASRGFRAAHQTSVNTIYLRNSSGSR